MKVLAKRRVIGSSDDALPYLLSVLRNTFVSSLRTRSRRPQTAPLEDSEARLAAPPPRPRWRRWPRARCSRRSPRCPTISATWWPPSMSPD